MRQNQKIPKILFPNEHGAWGIFFTTFLVGWLAAPSLSWRPLLILPAALGAFLTRYPIGLYFKKRRITGALNLPLQKEKKWFLIYLSFTLIVSAPLFYPLGWWWLFAFAGLSSVALALHLYAIIKKRERSLFTELIAMAGITFLAPAASYASILRFHWEPILVWLLLVLFYEGRTISVRKKVARKKEEPVDFKKVGNRELLFSFIFLITVSGLVRLAYLY